MHVRIYGGGMRGPQKIGLNLKFCCKKSLMLFYYAFPRGCHDNFNINK